MPAPAPTARVFLTIAETADLLRKTPKAVYCMVERGQLPAVVRCGRRVLIDRAALLKSLGVALS